MTPRDFLTLQKKRDKEIGAIDSLLAPHRFIADSVWMTKRGHVAVALALRGVDPSNLTDELLQTQSNRLSRAFEALPEEIRIYQYLIKRERGPIETCGDYPNEIVAETVRARNDAIQSRSTGLYAIDLVWVLLLEADSLPGAKGKSTAKTITVVREKLARHCDALLSAAASFSDQVKDLLRPQLLNKQESFAFLRRLTNFTDSAARSLPIAPDAAIDYLLMDESITIHPDGLRIGLEQIQVLSIRQGLTHTAPNLFRDIYELPCGVIICLEYKRVSIFEAQEQVVNAEEHFLGGAALSTLRGIGKLIAARGDTSKIRPDRASQENASEVGELSLRLNAGDRLGKFSTTIILHSPDPEKVATASAGAIKTFGRYGGSLYRETYNALNAYLSAIPGNAQFNKRQVWMLQSSVADASLVYAPDPGDVRNQFLNAEYLFVAETNSHTPHFLNLHVDDVCNFFACGATGAGKSVMANVILDHLQKYSPRTLILDIGGSYRHTCRKHGGSYASLDLSSSKTWAINPFSLPETDQNREYLEAFLRLLLSSSRYEATYRDDRAIHEAVGEIYGQREGKRQLSNLKLPDHLKEALYIWTGNGPYAHVFDNAEDNITFAKFQVFEMQGLESYPRILEPLFFYIFLRQQMVVQDPALRETMKFLLADEVWRFLTNKTCQEQFVSAAKTYRKNLGGLGLVTQSSFDLTKSRAARRRDGKLPHKNLPGESRG